MDFSHEQVKEILNRIESRLGAMRKRKYEFYSECGLSSAAYSQWNTGKNTPSVSTLRKIADYLNVSYEWLITGQGNEHAEDDNATMQLRQKLRERSDLRILFDAAEDAPTSAILEAASLIMRYKEQNQ